MSFCQTGRPVACAQCAFDTWYARATVVRARFLAAAFSDGSYLAHVNGAYLRHVKFCIVRGPPLFIVSPISQRGPASVRGPLPTVTVPGWSKVHDGDVEGVEQTCSSRQDVPNTKSDKRNISTVEERIEVRTYEVLRQHLGLVKLRLQNRHIAAIESEKESSFGTRSDLKYVIKRKTTYSTKS